MVRFKVFKADTFIKSTQFSRQTFQRHRICSFKLEC